MFKKAKKILSVILSCTMTISMLPRAIVSGEEKTSNEKYHYVLFSGGEGESLMFDANGFSINGNMHTNGTFVSNAINANVNGEVTAVNGFNILNNPNLQNKVKPSEKQKTIIIKQKVKDTYFTNNCDISEEAFELIDYNININKSLYSNATILTKGNLNLSASIGALNNIDLQGDSLNANNSVAIYSDNGDINFKFNNTNFTGLIYAPNGKVTIDSNNIQINGVIIAEEIEIKGQNVNLNYNEKVAQFVEKTSEESEPADEIQIDLTGEYYAEEDAINLHWSCNNEQPVFEVLTSKDNINYSTIANVSNAYNYIYKIVDETSDFYFKIRIITGGGKVVESEALYIKKPFEDIDNLQIYAEAEYNIENSSIDLFWESTLTTGKFSVYSSIDDVNYILLSTQTGINTYSYPTNDSTNDICFKVIQTLNNGLSKESNPVYMVYNFELGEYELMVVDTDGDELSDYYENEIGTDSENPDTDGDALTDYEEVAVLGTDPLKTDTDDNGVLDPDEDFDEDGLSNKQELDLELNPLSPDTDYDDLNDGEEINTYGTDPLLCDTDGDGLKDGDEPHIGLDPINPQTFGVPDADYLVEQTISAESEALSKINVEGSPYKLSVDITAAGYVEGNLRANETAYSKTIQNNSILGIAPELSYSNADSIESVTLKFEISADYVDNTLNMFPDEEELTGIKRLNVFKYFEDLNMLLPIETKFDVENNIIYTDVDELGTYCVMDMELWLNSFDVPKEKYQSTPMRMSLMSNDIAISEFIEEDTRIEFSGEYIAEPTEQGENKLIEETVASMMFSVTQGRTAVTVKTPVDIVFLLQTAGQLPSTFESQKQMIANLSERLYDEYDDVRIYIIGYKVNTANFIKTYTGSPSAQYPYCISANEVIAALNTITYVKTSQYCNRGTAFSIMINDVELRETAGKFVFQLMNGSSDVGLSYFSELNACARGDINYSEFIPSGYAYLDPAYAQKVDNAITQTGGLNLVYGTSTGEIVYNHIVDNVAPPQVKFDAIVPTGWKNITLEGVLDSNNGVNSDEGTLTDWEEVVTEKLSWDTDGSVILPTIRDAMRYTTKPYAEDGLKRFESASSGGSLSPIFNEYFKYILDNTYILPIRSDPTEEDSDDDGKNDNVDILPLMYSEIGSTGYFQVVDILTDRQTNRNTTEKEKAEIIINIMMDDVNKHIDTDIISNNDWDNFCVEFNKNVKSYGEVDETLHYFRNKLNRVPATLEEMIDKINSAENENYKWVMCSPKKARYHMYGIGGEFNTKFISSNSSNNIYEAVYDKNGNLITEENSYGKNMGTYNYASSFEETRKHDDFDVNPYEKWGNTLIDEYEKTDKKDYTKYENNVNAKTHYENICNEIGITYIFLIKNNFSVK